MPALFQLFKSPSLHFALFVFWLLSFPLGGPLLASIPGADNPAFFLFPHILSLVLAYRIPEAWRKNINFIAISGCVAGTLLPLFQLNGLWLLPLIGVCSAFICLNTCLQLTKAEHPAAAAAFGLVSANLLLFIMVALDATQGLHAVIAATAVGIVAMAGSTNKIEVKKTNMVPYLLCLLVFHLSSGLMYGYVVPHYNQVTFAPGIELLFYLLAIPIAYRLLRFGHDTLLIAAIGLAMFAFAMLIESKPIYFLVSMFSLQAAAGFSDLFVLAWIINLGGGMKEFGYALGSVCSGILIGQYLNQPASATIPGAVLIGNLALSLTLLSLYLLKKRELGHTHSKFPDINQPEEARLTEPRVTTPPVPNKITCILSSREQLVLEGVLRGETYLNIAGQLQVTESTIKTYMRRIREKTGTANKKELLQKLVGKE